MTLTNLCSTGTKSFAGMVSMADFISGCFGKPSLQNTIVTIGMSAISLPANLLANAAFYASKSGSTLPCAAQMSPSSKKSCRHTLNTLYSLSRAIFYMMSLVNFREHIKQADTPDFGFESTTESAITVVGIYSALMIFFATHAKFNVYIGKYLDEPASDYALSENYTRFAESRAVVVQAAIAVALISATSCFALVFQLASGDLIGALFASGLPVIFTAIVQWAVMRKTPAPTGSSQPLISARSDTPSPSPSVTNSDSSHRSSGLTARFWKCLGYPEVQNDGAPAQEINGSTTTSHSWCNWFSMPSYFKASSQHGESTKSMV